MQNAIDRIASAASGLYYLSESDFPFTPVILNTGEPATELASHAEAGAVVEIVTLPYFFRNMVNSRSSHPEEVEMASRFRQLQSILESELTDIKVYRFGKTEIDVFIIGRTSDGFYAGLQTKSIET